MRLTFHSVTWANFLSAPPEGLTVQLDAAPMTLFVGYNGSGKSSILDAIQFALFGEAFRDISKSDLVSWSIAEGATVDLKFSLNSTPYRVRRGIEPNLFEVFKADEKLSLPGKLPEQQKHFEQHILRLSPKSTSQIVMLGKAGYTPFLKLGAAARRAVVEDVLDISIFSRMADVLKPKIATLKADRGEALNGVRVAQAKLDTIIQAEAKARVSHADKIVRLKEQIKELQRSRDDALARVPSPPDKKAVAKLEKDRAGLQEELTKQSVVMRTAKNQLAALETDDVCPMCGQAITHAHKDKEKATAARQIATAEAQIAKLKSSLKPLDEAWAALSEARSTYQAAITAVAVIDGQIDLLKRQYDTLKDEKPPEVPDRAPVETELKDAQMHAGRVERTFDLFVRAAVLLKDDGIKGSVVRRFLPALNGEINAMLARFAAPMRFTFDETFEETIRMHYLHDCSAGSLSEGERLRAELAILMAWRNIAAKQASIDTNLLIMDEILDASLDAPGCAELLGVLREMGNNVIIISHRREEEFDNAFSRVLKFERMGTTSHIVEVKR
jgi:DNA repair exonuclease SbcCD ATPase subunit